MGNKKIKNLKNIIAITIITIIVIVVSIILATRDSYSYTKTCLYTSKEIENKLKEVTTKTGDSSYYYKKKHLVSLHDDTISMSMRKEEYDEKALYEFISLFIDIDEETFTEIINNSIKYNEQYEKENYMHINNGKYELYISVYNDSIYVSIDLCFYSFDDYHYSTSILDENNIKEHDLWVLKKFFNIDFKYSDLVAYLNKEAIDNKGSALLEINDEYKMRVLLGREYITYYSNYEYLYWKLSYGVTHGIADYQEKLIKDFDYLKTYFNYDCSEYLNSISSIISSSEYKEKGRYIKDEYDGNYYKYYKSLDNNCEIELKVFEDKIYFEFSFKE